jgi:hypothetical protein
MKISNVIRAYLGYNIADIQIQLKVIALLIKEMFGKNISVILHTALIKWVTIRKQFLSLDTQVKICVNPILYTLRPSAKIYSQWSFEPYVLHPCLFPSRIHC